MGCTHYLLAMNIRRFSLQNSGSLSVTIVFGTPFSENSVPSTCCTVVAILSVALIAIPKLIPQVFRISQYL